MSDSEYAEPAPKRQKQNPDAAPTTPVLIMKSEADATAMAKAASRFIGVPPFPDTAKFESDRPHEVIAPAFDAPPGKITIFVNSEKAGQMSLSINTKPEGAESEEWHEMAMDQLGFHQDSGIAKFFFRDAKAPKDNKQAARLAAKAKKEGVAEADLAAWLHKQARSDQMSACAFTKKLAGIGDDDTRFFKCNYNCLVPNKSSTAQREPEFTEKQLNSMPYELMLKVRELIAAGHEFKASPFFNLEGKRVPLAEIFSKFSTSGGGTIYANFMGQPKFSGLKIGWTTGKGSDNYNRILTVPFLRRVQLIAGISRNDVEEEEADDGLLTACMLAVSDTGAGPAAV